MKKLVSIFLTLVMIFSFATVTGFAVGDATGTITISPTAKDGTYKVYKLFDLHTYNEDAEAYTYLIADNSPWVDFFTSTEISQYFTIEAADYVYNGTTYNIIKATTAYTTTTAVDVAKKALDFADSSESIEPDAEETENGEDNKVEFTGLVLGYYLVDTSMGALCGLTTTDPDAEVAVKNYPPTLDKYVAEDDITVGNKWGVSNDAAFDEIVNFDITIYPRNGADSYIFHDAMENGLAYVEGSVVVEYVAHGQTEATATTLVKDTDYTITTTCDDGCDFEIHFSEALCNTLKDNDNIIITYNAKVIPLRALDENGIENKAWVSYGDIIDDKKQATTQPAITHTFSYGFDVIKTDAASKMLDGAEFMLYTDKDKAAAKDEDAAIKLIKLDENSYRLAIAGEEDVATKIIDVDMVDNKTIAKVIGLDNGTYYLAETKWPEGYNPLAEPKMFTISDGNVFATTNSSGAYDGTSGVHIENRTGIVMPETGAAGTAMFMMVGTVAVLGTGVLLVTKKRMSMIEE